MKHKEIIRIINILKDCEKPIYERNGKLWNLNKELAIISLERDLICSSLSREKYERDKIEKGLK
jgi:hypothetical protein